MVLCGWNQRGRTTSSPGGFLVLKWCVLVHFQWQRRLQWPGHFSSCPSCPPPAKCHSADSPMTSHFWGSYISTHNARLHARTLWPYRRHYVQPKEISACREYCNRPTYTTTCSRKQVLSDNDFNRLVRQFIVSLPTLIQSASVRPAYVCLCSLIEISDVCLYHILQSHCASALHTVTDCDDAPSLTKQRLLSWVELI